MEDLNNDGLPEIILGETKGPVFMIQNNSTPGNISFVATRMLADNTGKRSNT